ncbi:hypothetical protein FIBSPDRAFT_963708 [Athelia psychrophila]|uniref:CipC-like antibiotic response protein n=1 Tax=Athelia psychrophila TaxID=1759441 RepID=A0A165YNW6_9AGAM|nr:hypothetical protein FIBSPDRAFT_963708 [Fibularhizoctonia sp. CBS 109695]
MDFFSNRNHENDYQDVYHKPHEGSLGHEAIAGAAGFAAMRAYESHLRATGETPSHPLMKEMLAGIASAEVDKLIETKGLNAIDRHKAKKQAEEHAHALAEQRYGGGTGQEFAQQQGGYAGQYNFQGGGPPWGTPQCPSYGYGGPGYAPPQGPPQGYPPPGGYGGPPPPQQGYGGQYGGGPPQGGGYGGQYGGGPPQGGYGGGGGY